MPEHRNFIRFAACLAVLLLVYAGSYAARTMAAELIAYPASQQMKIDIRHPARLSDRQWRNSLDALHKAVAYRPDNPVLLHRLGKAYVQGFRYSSNSDPSAVTARQQAVEYFHKAISLRPSWPHDRVDYLLARYRLGDTDDEFYRQLLYANRLGPWEAWVQQVTAEIGLQSGDDLPGEVQEVFAASVMNGVQHPDGSAQMLGILRRYNSLDRVCGKIMDKRVINYCDRYYNAAP